MNTFNSTIASAGPEFFVVATPVDLSRGTFDKNFFSGVLLYQYEAIRRALGKLDDEAEQYQAPSLQITKSQAYSLVQYVEALEPFAFLQDGWNGPGTLAPSFVGLWQAVTDSYRLIAFGLPSPSPKLLSDGTLGVFWRHGSAYATIDFEADGVHLWTITDGKQFKTGTWDAEAKVPAEFRAVGKLSGSQPTREQVQADFG